jgi:hypothetical protein
MEIKLQTFRNAKKNDILRFNGKEYAPFPVHEILMPLTNEIEFLKQTILNMEKAHKTQIAKMLNLIKEINKNG